MVQNLRNKLHAQPARKAERHDQGGLACHGLRGNDTYAGRSHRAEHKQRGAAQHGLGHQREHPSHSREKPQQHQHGGYKIAHIAAGHTGELNHTVVLGKNGIGEGIEQAGQHGIETVGQNTARGAPHEYGSLNGLAGNERIGRDVAIGLDGRNQINKPQRMMALPSKRSP